MEKGRLKKRPFRWITASSGLDLIVRPARGRIVIKLEQFHRRAFGTAGGPVDTIFVRIQDLGNLIAHCFEMHSGGTVGGMGHRLADLGLKRAKLGPIETLLVTAC